MQRGERAATIDEEKAMATRVTTPQKMLLAAVGAVLGSALAVGGFAALAGPGEANAAQPISVAAPLGVKQGVAGVDVPADAPLGTAPVGIGGPVVVSGPSGGPTQGPPGNPADQGGDPATPGPGDPLYDPPIVTDPGPGPVLCDPGPCTGPMPGDPLYDPPIVVTPDPIVRDHRNPGYGSDPADASGGTVVTPSDGGPIVRDHRTEPIVRDHRTGE